jgi:hypothetical protein
MRIRATLALAALVLVPFAAACGDDGGKDTSTEAQNFCSVVTPVQALAGISDRADDPAALKVAFSGAESALAAVSGTPPTDIAADLTTVTTTFNAANTVLKANAYSYEAAAAKDAKAIEALDDPAFTKATDNIQAWAVKNCAGFAK